jgi:uncharacterized protein YbaR (Trm112 family)
LDRRLLDILVCPICKGKLTYERGGTGADGAPIDGELVCRPDRLAYPVRDGIPVMLVDEARRIEQAL